MNNTFENFHKWLLGANSIEKLLVGLNRIDEDFQKYNMILESGDYTGLKEEQEIKFKLSDLKNIRQLVTDKIKKVEDKEFRKLLLAETRQNKPNKIAIYRAHSASLMNSSRALGKAAKRKIEKSINCPYCNKILGNDAEADHIYPIIYGGLSIDSNMVFVCKQCNRRKKMLTLNEFIDQNSHLCRIEIEKRLKKLNKKF